MSDLSSQAEYFQQQLDTAKQRYRELEENITWILSNHSEGQKVCKCGVTIWFLKNPKSGKMSPFCFDGTQHFKNCPNVKEFKR